MMVLVVDDEESLCELLAEILSEKYEVIKAYNGKDALELARQRRPDLVISDVMMPHMSGVELLKALRDDPETKKIPMILLSAASPQSVAQEAQAFIRKPFELEVLEKIVDDVAEKTIAKTENENKFPKLEAARPVTDPYRTSLPNMGNQYPVTFRQSQH